MLRLTQDWTIELDNLDILASRYGLNNFKNITVFKKKVPYGRSGQMQDREFVKGTITFPAGTILRYGGFHTPSRYEKLYYAQKPYIPLKVVETTAEYKVDSKPLLTKKGRVSKKKTEKPKVILKLPVALLDSFEFEYTI